MNVFRRFVSKYDALYSKYPIYMAGATMGSKASVCDIIAQRYEDPECSIDWHRCGKFTFFCVAYVGSFQHVVFNVVYPRMFSGLTGWKQAGVCALFDNFVHSPFLYLPTYYMYRSYTSHGSLTDGFNQYKEEGFGVLQACWGIWVPAQFINFRLVPPNLRILFIAGVGSLWEIVLAYMAPMKHTGPLTDPHQEGFEEGDSERTVRRRLSEVERAAAKARQEELEALKARDHAVAETVRTPPTASKATTATVAATALATTPKAASAAP